MNSSITQSPTTSSVPPIAEAALDDLRRRLDGVRWPQVVDESATGHGISVARTRELVERWRTTFDWRGVERELDRLGQRLLTTPDGRRLHLLHAKAPAATGLPILLVHGWPDSALRFTKLVPLLTAAGHDVVVPTLPGYGWSEQPQGEISVTCVAEDVAWLMTELGYERYAAHGGDWGSAIATAVAEARPEAVVALHLSDVPWDKTFAVDPAKANPAERAYLDGASSWAAKQTYLLANTHNPDTVALALSDSPVGLLAWIAEMYDRWSEDPIPDDDVLALVSLLWLTNSVRSSIRLYSEPAGNWDDSSSSDGADDGADDASADVGAAGGWSVARVEVPTAFALFPRDLAGVPPRELAERFFPVARFTVMPRGGHFAALEQPELMAEDLIAFLAGREAD